MDKREEKDGFNLDRIADLLFEAGMLKNIPRSGFAFLGSGRETIAEHSYRVALIGYVLSRLAGVDPAKTTFLCLFHDLHEARTGDFNYVNHRYNVADARGALADAVEGTGLDADVMAYWDELERRDSRDALLAHDADQLDLILNLRQEEASGNEFATEWLTSARERLKTKEGRELAEAILAASPHRWWYDRVDKKWWVAREK